MFRYDPLPILSRHTPLGEGDGSVVLNETAFPLKHTDWSSDEPPNDEQKLFSDCQTSVSSDDELGSCALPCKEG
jgi:hypothetical protein